MVKQQLDDFLDREGYTKIPSNLPEFTIYFHMENNCVNVLHIIDYREGLYISEDQYDHLKDKIKTLFEEKGVANIHILSLILSKDMEKSKRLCTQDHFCWILNPADETLVVYENQVNDFYGMRGSIERWLKDIPPLEYKEENIKKEKKKLPTVTVFFVAVNVLVFLLCTFTGDLLYNKGTFSVLNIMLDKEYYRIFTSIFLHWDINHLMSNMLILYYLGEVVEKHFGHIRYALIFCVTGIFGNCLSMGYELYSNSYAQSAGASGAVFGIIGVLFFLVIIHRGKFKHITIGRMLFMVCYSLYSGFVGSNINNAAHIGGFLCGAGCSFFIWLWDILKMNREKRKSA